ncbi:MAG TPA: hypothetical protein DCP90_00935 [Clostridiales bacterium]|nr:MAG: hypothetical protein A2Y22_07810 [Clostridiales bacterium GWD2_32_59]HAN09161.1 hypothetical protein [Clostridiales bacterium]
MKTMIRLTLIIMTIFYITGCGNKNNIDINKQNQEQNIFRYEIIDRLPGEKIQSEFDKIDLKNRGFAIISTDDQTKYVYIFSGIKERTGYKIDVVSVEESDDSVNIKIKEVSPTDVQSEKETKTYATVTLQVRSVADNINVTTVDGEILEKVN